MTMQYAVLPARSGRSYTAKLFTVADPDTEVTGNTITVTERTNAKGMFRASIDRTTALPAGDYILVLLQGTLGAAVGYLTFAGTDGETATETPAIVELDSASLRRFVTEDTGETAAASGSVAKLAQGTGSLSPEQQAQLDLIEVAVSGGQVVSTTGFGIPDASGALLLKRGHTATITFTSATSNIVTDLSGSGKKVFFGVRTVSGNLLISGVEGTVLVATGLQSVRFTLTASQALALVAGVHLYDVVCVYGYDSNLDPPYASMEPFTGGYVRVQEVGVDLAEL